MSVLLSRRSAAEVYNISLGGTLVHSLFYCRVAIYFLCSVDCSLGVIYVSHLLLYDILVLQHEVVSDTMTFGDRLIRLLPIFLVVTTPLCKSN